MYGDLHNILTLSIPTPSERMNAHASIKSTGKATPDSLNSHLIPGSVAEVNEAFPADLGSYPPTPTPPKWPIHHTLPLVPIHPPPTHILSPTTKPSLPSPARNPAFSPTIASKWTFKLSTHIIPACYLRSTPYCPEPSYPRPDASKTERLNWVKDQAETLLGGGKVERAGMEYEQPGPGILWNCVNRYVKKDPKESGTRGTGVTLFFVHAAGFLKEIWELVVNILLSTPAGAAVDEVWAWEAIQHGDAGLLNKGRLGSTFDWTNNARDILNFLLYYLPSSATSKPLPLHLEQISLAEKSVRKLNGFEDRKLMCIGHSYGGFSSMLAAITEPQLFSSLIVIDPIILRPDPTTLAICANHTKELVFGALLRRETWTSRQQAFDTLAKLPFFGAWEKETFKVYVECGTFLIDGQGNDTKSSEGHATDGLGEGYRLKTSAFQEALAFSEPYTRTEVYLQVPKLDSRIKLRWVMPGRPDSSKFGPPGSARERVWLRPKNAANVRILGARHLIPQEQPNALAEYLSACIVETNGIEGRAKAYRAML